MFSSVRPDFEKQARSISNIFRGGLSVPARVLTNQIAYFTVAIL
jgi:hypothetical protein